MVEVDHLIESFYKYFAFFLVFVVILLGSYYFYLSNVPEDIITVDNSRIAVLETNLGTIKIDLYLNKSPITAGNFKKLVNEGYYDRIKFHRIIDGFMIQGGDPNTKESETDELGRWGTGGPGYTIDDEFIEGLSNVRGTISMANSGPNSGGSQFFINVVDNTFLDWDKEPVQSKHPVFGRVIEGMDIVDKIAQSEVLDNVRNIPKETIAIEKAYMETD